MNTTNFFYENLIKYKTLLYYVSSSYKYIFIYIILLLKLYYTKTGKITEKKSLLLSVSDKLTKKNLIFIRVFRYDTSRVNG